MTYTPANIVPQDPIYVGTHTDRSLGIQYHSTRQSTPVSGSWSATNRAFYYPFFVSRGYSLARWWWQNGGGVGTNYIEVGIYDENFNLVRAAPRTLSAGTVNEVQYANPGVHGTNVISSGSITDATSYVTASVTLKAGVLYLMAVENSKASAANAVSAISGGPTFTSRSTTTYNTSTANRVSIWSAVPTTNYTGTLTIDFGGGNTQTGAVWSLNAFYHVDTATTDGIVQNAVGTGSSVTPLATLSAFGSSENAAMGAFGQAANATGAVTSAASVELSDSGIATPVQALQTTWAKNDTTMDETISSAQWGACAVEIKSLGTGAVAIPRMRGWLAMHCDGTTAAFFRDANAVAWTNSMYLQSSLTGGLPYTATPATSAGVSLVYNFGFTSRSSP